MIFNPLEEYESKYKQLHHKNARAFLDELIAKAQVNADENRKTVKHYADFQANRKKLQSKLNWLQFLRVLTIITILLIPIAIWVLTPKIKALRQEIASADKQIADLLSLSWKQMNPLNRLFSDRDALTIIEKTLPDIQFAPCFSVEQELDMSVNYDFSSSADDTDHSTLDVLSGTYNENPFLFETRLVHRMGMETYHGYKTIHWTSTAVINGKHITQHHSQTLHATVTKPKPFYSTQFLLHYCSQAGPDLSFTRDATHLDQKSDKALERYVKRGEKKLKRKTDKAIKQNQDFVSMSNTDFEVLFDATDRDHEVQFRTLFTPLAQTNVVDLIRSQSGYGDDFDFIKRKRTNRIITKHSQGRNVNLLAASYQSYDYDAICQNFLDKNAQFFKELYFDFAPLWAIPAYQERPVHSLKPIPDHTQQYSIKECETLSNLINEKEIAHPKSQTRAIVKSSFIESKNGIDEIGINAYSYDIAKQTDFVTMLGGDGRLHTVHVPWDEYLPLQTNHRFFVAPTERAKDRTVLATRNHLSIFNHSNT